MSRRIAPLKKLVGDQALAADPMAHASLSASAGTGKTQVLTARVLRLLLSGADPESILCLTFTKAGAAEMANRIGERLAAWVRMKTSDLKTDLINMGEVPTPPLVERARRLFARVLDARGGLRIQTIHSFAQTLLASFPAEAGIAPGIEPIEGRAEQELARTTLATLIGDAETAGDLRLLSDMRKLSLRLGEGEAVKYLLLCARHGDALEGLGPADGIEPRVRALLNVPEGDVASLIEDQCSDESFDCDLLRSIAAINRQWGTTTGAGHVERIERWLALDSTRRAEQLPDLALVVLTGSGEPRKVSAGQTKTDPEYQAHADRLAKKIGELMEMQRRTSLAGDISAGLRAGQAFADAYGRAKRSAGVADYDDLIRWSRELLESPDMGDWIRYKLDRRTDHILVDESQDTNQEQWEIIKALASDFFSGSSEGEGRHRTLFMVGDFKQAIFGFQGTDPREFERARGWLRDSSEMLDGGDEDFGAGQQPLEFRDLSIDASFRSAPAVLGAVDAMIAEVGYSALGLPAPPNPHRAFFSERPGSVELWAPFTIEEAEEGGEEGWLDEEERQYAARLARQVRLWIDEAPTLSSTRRPLCAGDILILVRSRGELASLIVARLFSEGVPVAGIDRLHLHKPLAVKDLLAAMTFAVQPLDDLNLANLLVSPLVGWSQDQLFDLAHGRGRTPLWEALGRRSGEKTEFAEARKLLGSFLAMADFTTPHRFLETLLSGGLDGRRKLYSRLDLSARDPIDELLSSALEFEQKEIPSLDRFLSWFSRGEVEVKRDPSAPMDAVRVMTVHGAKGLEAPVVILADATADPAKLGGVQSSIQLPVPDAGSVPMVRPRKNELVSPFAEVMANRALCDLEEHWRLLYVGMTRASERLIVAGLDKGDRPADSWHARVEAALLSLGADWEEDGSGQPRLIYKGEVGPERLTPRPPQRERVVPSIPQWLGKAAPPEARPPRPLSPSAIAEDVDAALPPSSAMAAAARRGTLIHQLLERLADVPAEDRRPVAMRWLEQSAGVAEAHERKEIAETVCTVLTDPALSALFGPGSLGEAPLAATLADGRVIAGTVDRLLVEPECISVADFKTGAVPATTDTIPATHRLQMAAYADALGVIFPGRRVRSLLVYTGGPRLFEL